MLLEVVLGVVQETLKIYPGVSDIATDVQVTVIVKLFIGKAGCLTRILRVGHSPPFSFRARAERCRPRRI